MSIFFTTDSIAIECIVDEDVITIKKSYLLSKDEDKISVIQSLLNMYPEYAKIRSVKDMLNEWKVHNILYNRNKFVKSTKDTELERVQSKFKKICYAIVVKLFKETK